MRPQGGGVADLGSYRGVFVRRGGVARRSRRSGGRTFGLLKKQHCISMKKGSSWQNQNRCRRPKKQSMGEGGVAGLKLKPAVRKTPLSKGGVGGGEIPTGNP